MTTLHLYLLGTPEIKLDNTPVLINRRKELALLIYLAMPGDRQTRDALATLLWPDYNQQDARSHLRRDLSLLNKTLGEGWLHIERETIGLCFEAAIDLDVAEFQRQLANCQTHNHAATAVCPACIEPLRQAVKLYRGDFLTGFTLADSVAFDDWQTHHTEQLRMQFARSLEKLVQFYSTQGEFAQAIEDGRRWLVLDRLYEPAHRHLMQLYAWSGQLSLAVQQYQECVRLLDEELGAPPEEETTRLYQAIRNRRLPAPTLNPLVVRADMTVVAAPLTTRPPTNLPRYPTPFVGRVQAVAQLVQQLADPHCRLLTISGPGGIGKTRLAVQVAHNLLDLAGAAAFADGIFFVALATVSSADLLASRIADAVYFGLQEATDPKVQLYNYLRHKTLLLVLDNFEHLLDGIALLSDILAMAPSVKLLVTSRESLNLQAEWYYPLTGLAVPDQRLATTAGTALEGYDAVQLFVQHACRVLPTFSLTAEASNVLQICRLAEGTPLAIELAAVWLKVLPCQVLAQEVQRSFNDLTTPLRDVPERHRSMRALFEHVWRLLTNEERIVLSSLAVFRGGFRRAALEAVTNADFRTLLRLVEKSLLQPNATGRYTIHELLRQFAEEKLVERAQEQATVRDRHGDYFLAFLAQRTPGLLGEQQAVLLEEISQEIDNIATGWYWAAMTGKIQQIDQVIDGVYDYYRIRSRYAEGVEMFAQASQWLQPLATDRQATRVLGRIEARCGALWIELGRYGQAKPRLETSLALARQLDEKKDIAFCLHFVGRLSWWQAGELTALPYLEESLALSRAIADRVGVAATLHMLTWIFVQASEFARARSPGEECLAVSQQLGHTYTIAHISDQLGTIAFASGDYRMGIHYYQDALALCKQLGDRMGIALALSGLGRSMYGSGEFPRATFMPLLEESVERSRESGNYFVMYPTLGVLGQISNCLGEYATGQRCGEALIALSREMHTPLVSLGFVILGEALLGLGQLPSARHYLWEGLSATLKSQTRVIPTGQWALLGWANLLYQESLLPDGIASPAHATQKQAKALEIVALLLHDRKIWPFWRVRAFPLAAKLETMLPTEVIAAAKAQGQAKNIMTLVTEIAQDAS